MSWIIWSAHHLPHMWPDLKKPGFHTHKIKLIISPEMDYWLNTLLYSTVFLTSLISVAAFLKPYVSLSGTLAPLNGHGSLVLVFGGLDKGLANVCYLQFGQERSSRAWTSGFQLSSYSILYSYIKPTPYPPPLLLPHAISLLSQKSCSKQLEFQVFESYSPTQL